MSTAVAGAPSDVVDGERESWAERLFVGYQIFAQVYYWWRYPFQYSSSGISFTYADTPFVLQAAKYGIAVVLTLAMTGALATQRQNIRARFPGYAGAFWGLFAFAFTYYAILSGVLAVTDPTEFMAGDFFKASIYLPAVLLMPWFYRGRQSLDVYLKLGAWFLGYHCLYSLIQILLFLVQGRTPALTIAALVPRFGGGWDDPNTFGAFLIIAIVALIATRKGRLSPRRIAAIATLSLLMLLTLSFAGMGGLVAALFVYAVLAREWRLLSRGIAALIVIGALLYANGTVRDAIDNFIELKQGSVGQHLSALDWTMFANDATVLDYLFGAFLKSYFHETYYINLFMHSGIIGVSLLLAILAATFLMCVARVAQARRMGDLALTRMFAAFGGATFGFAIGSAGIPYFSLFPGNFFFWTMVGCAWLTPVRRVSPTFARARRPSLLAAETKVFSTG